MTLKSTLNRRAVLCTIAAAGIPALASATPKKIPKELIASVPVLPWLTVGVSTQSSIRGPIQSMLSGEPPKPWFREGPSEITGGSYMNISRLAGNGMLGETGLRILTIVFDTQKVAQLVIFSVERGWQDANIKPLINRITSRYLHMADPVIIRDGESEATDYFVFFDMGRFVVEIMVPQHGTFLTVNFTTKEIHKRMRLADGTYQLFKPYLEQ